jgi:hypothetical protein
MQVAVRQDMALEPTQPACDRIGSTGDIVASTTRVP